MSNPIVFYDCNPAAEQLYYTAPDEAIEAYLADIDEAHWPTLLPVYAWRRVTVQQPRADRLVAHVLEELDEEYNGGEKATDGTQEMLNLAESFLEEFTAQYQKKSWACEMDAEPVFTAKVGIGHYSYWRCADCGQEVGSGPT